MRILIVDDEPLARRALVQLLRAHEDVVIAGECADGTEVLERLRAADVDVVLLDIRMPERSGLDVAALVGEGVLVAFVTAHEEFGLQAFERGAADYLLKPVTQRRLDAALQRLRTRLAAAADAARYRELQPPPAPRTTVERLIARVGNRDVLIPVEEVELIAADDVYAAVHAGRRRYLVRMPLDTLEHSLAPDRFVRVHRSYIVPLAGVVAVRRTGSVVELELRNGATVPVSRRRRSELARLEAAAARG